MPEPLTSELDSSDIELEGSDEEDDKDESEEGSEEAEENDDSGEPGEGEEDAEEKEEGKDDPLEALRTELTAEHSKELEGKDKEINRLGYALRTANKEKVETKGDSEQFTDAQLLAIMNEHKEDPTVLLQVMKEVSKANGKDIEESVGRSADIKTKLVGQTTFLEQSFPDVLKEGTEAAEMVEKARDYMHLKDHPFGDWLAVATYNLQNMPQIIEKAKAEAKAEALGKTADDTRKQKIKTNTPGSSGKSNGAKTPALSKTQNETARMLFPKNKKLQEKYAGMLGKSKGTFTSANT